MRLAVEHRTEKTATKTKEGRKEGQRDIPRSTRRRMTEQKRIDLGKVRRRGVT